MTLTVYLRCTTVAVVLLLAFFPALAQAGVLPSHTRLTAAVAVNAGVGIEGDAPADTGPVSIVYEAPFGYPETWTSGGSARAISGLESSHFLRIASSAFYNSFIPGNAGEGYADAYWRDIAYLTTLTTIPDFITLHFHVDAILSGDGPSRGSRISVNASTDVVDTALPWYVGFASVGSVALDPPPEFQTAGLQTQSSFDSLDLSPVDSGLRVRAAFHIDAPYNPAVDGYDWGVLIAAVASADVDPDVDESGQRTSWAHVSSLQSVGLDLVTDPDGNVLNPTFDSGLGVQAAAVPEPSTLIVFSACGIVLAIRKRVRRITNVDSTVE